MLDFNHPNQLKRVYQSKFLTKELYEHALNDSDSEFIEFQMQFLVHFLPNLDAQAASVILCEMDGNGLIASTSNAVSHNLVANEMDAYRTVQHLDVTRPAILRNVGTAIFNTDFKTLDEWKVSPIFARYFQPLNVMHSVSLAFAIPFHQNQRLQFTYFKNLGQEFSNELTKDEVEYLSIPFFYCWAFRFGILDEATFLEWMTLLVGRNPKQLFLLRNMIAMKRYSIAAVAQKFGMDTRLVNHYFTEIYTHILPLLTNKDPFDGNAAKMVDIASAYNFLKYVGAYRPRN